MHKKLDSDTLERIRTLALAGIFVCSLLLCLSFLVAIRYSWRHAGQSFPYERVFAAGDLILIAVMAAMALASRLFIVKRAAGVSGSKARSDERIAFLWMKAYRLAFFVLMLIQMLSKLPIMIGGWPWDVPFQSALTLSAALAVSTGAFLIYGRGPRHD